LFLKPNNSVILCCGNSLHTPPINHDGSHRDFKLPKFLTSGHILSKLVDPTLPR